MALEYAYPTYQIDVTPDEVRECRQIAIRILNELGFHVAHEGFLSKLRGKPGLRIDAERVYFDPALSREYLDRWLAGRKVEDPPPPGHEWTVTTAGYSMATIDLHTEEVRMGTRQDLRDMIKLTTSCGVGGSYMIMPQDLPPLMRAIACFKICYEMSDKIRPYDYQMKEQTRFIYDMHQVMGRPFDITLTVPTTMVLDPRDVDTFLDFYPEIQRDVKAFRFAPLDYGMVGITKPVTLTGCSTMTLASTLAIHILFNLFDPRIETPVGFANGHPTDLKNACWAFGSPRTHLFRYIQARLTARLAGHEPTRYVLPAVHLETSSPAIDETAALEKTASGLMGAMLGARTFSYAGVLCVDDVYSGTQFIIDLELVDHIREMVEAFSPHPDIVSMDGLWDECRDACLGVDEFISHPNTLARFRNVVPSPRRIVREKLRSWLSHGRLLKDRAREEAIERIRAFQPTFRLPDDKQRELDTIYARAEAELGK